MRLSPRSFILLFILAIPFFLFESCNQVTDNAATNGDDNGGYASDASRIEWATDDVISLADAAGTVYNGAYMRTAGNTLGTCATVGTDTSTGTTHYLVISIGSNNGGTSTGNDDCTCLDGRKRRGTIVVSYQGNYIDAGQVHTITFDNYFINDIQLTGSIQTLRVNDSLFPGNWYYNVVTNDSMNNNNQIIAWNASTVRKWITGYATPTNRNDDVFGVAGNGLLTRANGHQFTFGISSPLQVAIGCNFVQSGIVNISGYTGTRMLNYGNGGCDANSQLNIGNSVYNITLVP